jgi:hypothetical protein
MCHSSNIRGTTVTNQNLIQEEIKRRLNSDNACYYSVQNLLSSRLLSKNLKIRICKTIILPVLLYGCETWSLTLREEHRLRVFENKVLRRIFGPKRDEVTGEWRKLHNEELRNLYSSPSIIRIMKPLGRRPLGRPRRRWVDNIRMDLVEVGWGNVDWICLAQDRNRCRSLVKLVLNLWVPLIVGNNMW